MKHFFTWWLLLIATNIFANNENSFDTIPSAAPSYQTIIAIDHQFNKPLPSFPRDFYKHRNISYDRQVSLFHYTVEQLQQYFNYHQYSETQILNQQILYLSDEFVKLAKTYTGYEQAIEQLHKKFKKFGPLKKFLHAFSGTYSSSLKRRIYRLYQEIQVKKIYQTKQEIFTENLQNVAPTHSLSDSYITEYQELKSVYEQFSPSLAKAIEKRIQAQQHSFHQLQHVIHLESIDIIKEAHALPTYSIIYPHQSALIDCATAISDYNNEGLVGKAICIADFCWTLLDYGQAVVEGAVLGLYATAQDFIENPIETTVCIVAGKQVLAYQLCKVLYNVADIGFTAITDFNHAKEKWDDYIAPINNLITAIQNKEITLRESLKTGTTFVIGYKAQSKLLGGLGKFCKTSKQNAIRFAQNNPLFGPQNYLTTPEGMLLKATNQVKKDFEKTNSSNLKKIIENKIIKVNTTPTAILKNGYYEVNGFKFTEYYYNYLWNNGRKAPSLIAKTILENATTIIPDPKQIPGFFKYLTDGWEMIYNPTTKTVSHIQPKPK